MKAFARREPVSAVPAPPRRGLGGAVFLTPGQGLGGHQDLELQDDPSPDRGPLRGSRRALRRFRSRHLREDNPQATWTSGSRLGTRAGTAALVAAIACGPIAMAWQALTPQQAPATAVAASTVFDERMESRRAIAAEIGLQWVQAWLTTSSQDVEQLRSLYAGEVTLPKAPARVADLRVADSVPADVGVWSVTVVATVTAAGAKTGATRYFAVPIAVSGGGEEGPVAASPMSVPAPVQGPAPVQVRAGGEYPAFVNTGSPLGATVAAFLGAYTSGADVSRYVTPGSTVRPIGDATVGYAAVTALSVRADRDGVGITDARTAPADGEQVRVLATARLTERGAADPMQQGLSTQLPLTLTARGGRWEITSVDTALAQTNGAQPTAAPPS